MFLVFRDRLVPQVCKESKDLKDLKDLKVIQVDRTGK
jgi:hypothetical protein